MFPFLNKAIDRFIIKRAAGALPKPGTFQPHIDEAQEIITDPNFFPSTVSAPGNIAWTSEEEFEFDSSICSPWECNNRVFGKFQKAKGKDWTSNPTVVLVHGWNDEIGYVLRHPYQARKFLQAGLNVAQLQLPYHLKRRPRQKGMVNDFLSEDLRCTLLAAKQAITDIRALLAWLQAEGCENTGLLGVSLGGWLTGLVATQDQNVKFALMNVPVSRMDRVVQELEFAAPLRHSVEIAKERNVGLSFQKLNLRSYLPKAPLDKILIVEAVDDLFACKDAIEEFWAAWGKPEIWRVNHAHISGLFSPGLLKRQVQWVVEKTK